MQELELTLILLTGQGMMRGGTGQAQKCGRVWGEGLEVRRGAVTVRADVVRIVCAGRTPKRSF